MLAAAAVAGAHHLRAVNLTTRPGDELRARTTQPAAHAESAAEDGRRRAADHFAMRPRAPVAGAAPPIGGRR